MICKTCGAEVPEPGMYCSAVAIAVCQGHAPEPGCGNVLTAEERHWYGTCCEVCERRWGDRMDAWSNGGTDLELDEMFSVPQQVH